MSLILKSELNKENQTRNEKSKYWTWLRDIVIFAVVIGAIMFWQKRDMLSTNGSVIVKQQNLVSLQGEVLPLLSNTQVNLVYFFAPWCQICELSIDNLAYLNAEKINVVTVALDYGTKEAVAEFAANNELSQAVLFGNDQLKQEFAIQGYPTYYLIDENQKVLSSSYGYSTAVGLKLREVFGN